MSDARETQVQQQCIEMERLCEALHVSITAMEDRLQAVLPGSESEAVLATGAQEVLVPHAEFLRGCNARIVDAIEQLDRLRERLEL